MRFRTHRMLAFGLVLVLGLAMAVPVSAANTAPVLAYLKPDVTIVRNGEILNFFDEQGSQVYPVIYKDRTYLPLRALCGIMREDIEWDGPSGTIFIGKTLSNPAKVLNRPETSPYVKVVSEAAVGAQQITRAYIKDKLLIMYDFEVVTFRDPAGNVQYPINVGGTTYLPISALETFMTETIYWDNDTKSVIMGSATTPVAEEPQATAGHADELIDMYQRESELYNEAIQLILMISSASEADVALIASDMSDKYILAQHYNADVKTYTKDADSSFTKEELTALNHLGDFAEFTEHYILIMENMAYLAASGQDYSEFADVFMNFALMAQKAMDETAEALLILGD